MSKTVGIGHQDFEQIITTNNFYIDKTSFIKEWWENSDTDLYGCCKQIRLPPIFKKGMTVHHPFSNTNLFFSYKPKYSPSFQYLPSSTAIAYLYQPNPLS